MVIVDTEALLTALAHPLRRRLLDVLAADGPATVSALAERTGEAVGNISHHLRILARADAIEPAPELARDARERWWRRRAEPLRWSALDADGPAMEAVATAAEAVNLQRQLGALHRWLDERAAAPERWQRAAFSTDAWLRLTPDELGELEGELTAIVQRWSDRTAPGTEHDNADDRRPVFMFARGFPGRP